MSAEAIAEFDWVTARPETEFVDLAREMHESIGRTMLAGSVRLSAFSPDQMSIANQRVADAYGEQARTLTIIGPDCVRVNQQGTVVLKNQRQAELLSGLLRLRGVLPAKNYLDDGFFADSKTADSRSVTLSRVKRELASSLVDTNGFSLIKTRGIKHGHRFGIDDVVIQDLRNTRDYRRVREVMATPVFVESLRDGGPIPDLAEVASIRSAKAALRQLAGRNLSPEQTERFKSLNRHISRLAKGQTDPSKSPESAAVSTHVKVFIRGLLDTNEPWYADAACKGNGHLFYSGLLERKMEKLAREKKAKAICAECPVQVQCQSEARQSKEIYGIWGGQTEDERY